MSISTHRPHGSRPEINLAVVAAVALLSALAYLLSLLA
jgi:hypothetical protein